jgi:hypothetical protein
MPFNLFNEKGKIELNGYLREYLRDLKVFSTILMFTTYSILLRKPNKGVDSRTSTVSPSRRLSRRAHRPWPSPSR